MANARGSDKLGGVPASDFAAGNVAVRKSVGDGFEAASVGGPEFDSVAPGGYGSVVTEDAGVILPGAVSLAAIADGLQIDIDSTNPEPVPNPSFQSEGPTDFASDWIYSEVHDETVPNEDKARVPGGFRQAQIFDQINLYWNNAGAGGDSSSHLMCIGRERRTGSFSGNTFGGNPHHAQVRTENPINFSPLTEIKFASSATPHVGLVVYASGSTSPAYKAGQSGGPALDPGDAILIESSTAPLPHDYTQQELAMDVTSITGNKYLIFRLNISDAETAYGNQKFHWYIDNLVTTPAVSASRGAVFVPISGWAGVGQDQFLAVSATLENITNTPGIRVGFAYRFGGFGSGFYAVTWDPFASDGLGGVGTKTIRLERETGLKNLEAMAQFASASPTLGPSAAKEFPQLFGGAVGDKIYVADRGRPYGLKDNAPFSGSQWGLYIETFGAGTCRAIFNRVSGLGAQVIVPS